MNTETENGMPLISDMFGQMMFLMPSAGVSEHPVKTSQSQENEQDLTATEAPSFERYFDLCGIRGQKISLNEYAEKVTGREGWQTIDFAEAELLQNRAKNDFIKLCSDYSPFNNKDFDRLEKAITNDAELNSRCTTNTLPGGQREICLWGRSEEGAAGLIEALREYARGLALWKQEFTEKDGFRVGYMSPIRGAYQPGRSI